MKGESKWVMWATGLNGLNMAVSVATTLLLTRALGAVGYGRWALYLAGIGMGVVVLFNWMYPGVVRFAGEEFSREGTVRRSMGLFWRWTLFSAILSIVAWVALRRSLGEWLGLHGWAWMALWLGVIGSGAGRWLVATLRSRQNFGAAIGLTAAPGIGFLVAAATVLRAYRGGSALEAVLWSYGLVWMGVFAVGIRLNRSFVGSERPGREFWNKWLTYSAPFLLTQAAGYASDWMDVYFLRYFGSPSDVGVYHAGYRTMQMATTLLWGIGFVYFPALVKSRFTVDANASDEFVQRLPRLAAVWGAGVLILLPVAWGLLPWALGREFEASRGPLLLLLPASAYVGISTLLSPLLHAYDRTRQLAITQILMAASNLGLDVLLIPTWGILGAATGTLVSYAIGAFTYVFWSRGIPGKRLDIPWSVLLCPLPALGVGLAGLWWTRV